MASVLNRTTKEFRRSVNTPDYPPASWIIEPDLAAVAGFEPRYWIITGDVVTLMSPAQRATVDANTLTAARDIIAAQFDQVENSDRGFMLVVLDAFNAVNSRLNSLLTAIDNAATLAALKTAAGGIARPADRTAAQLRDAVRAKLGS